MSQNNTERELVDRDGPGRRKYPDRDEKCAFHAELAERANKSTPRWIYILTTGFFFSVLSLYIGITASMQKSQRAAMGAQMAHHEREVGQSIGNIERGYQAQLAAQRAAYEKIIAVDMARLEREFGANINKFMKKIEENSDNLQAALMNQVAIKTKQDRLLEIIGYLESHSRLPSRDYNFEPHRE